MSLHALLERLARDGVRLSEEAGALRVRSRRQALTEELREELRRYKPELLSLLRAQPSDTIAGASVGVSPLPLSAEQRRLWFIHHAAPDSAAYNVHFGISITGEPDVPALERALATLVARHEILRTVYHEHAGTPIQIVLPDAPVTLERRAPDSPDPDALEQLMSRLAAEPFRDLAAAPPLRVYLIAGAPQRHVLLFVLHHIATDWWSVTLMLRELGELYLAETDPFAPPRPLPPALPYRDYACWQQRRAGEFAPGLAWWADYLADLAPLRLAGETLAGDDETYTGAVHAFTVPANLVSSLRRLGQGEECTLFVVILASFFLLLHRHSGQHGFSVGTVVANREREVQDTLGFFANTIAVRCDTRQRPTFRELLRRARDSVQAAFAHGDVPFDLVVRRLRAGRRERLFDTMFVLESVPVPELAVPQWRPRLDEASGSSQGTAKFALGLVLCQAADGSLRGGFEYATARFTEAAIAQLTEQLHGLWRALVADPDLSIDAVPLVDPSSRTRILAAGQGPPAFPVATLHGLFTAQARRTPAALAISGERDITYHELDVWSDELAAALQDRGVGLGTVVGLLLPRSALQVAACLAVLKAGGAFLPLDPAHPLSRLRTSLTDASATLVLVDDDDRLDDALGVPVVAVSALQGSGRRPTRVVDLEAPAYVLYTSGSTGRPNGVLVGHRAAANAVQALAELRQITSTSRVLRFAPLIFDAAVAEVFSTLSRGACLLIQPQASVPGTDLATAIDPRVTHLAVAASTLAALERVELPDLAVISVGGEVCTPEVAAWWGAGRQLICEYGVTEASICSASSPLDPARTSVIGRPIAGVKLYVLDERREPVPVGMPGELFIGGVGVALGYVGRPDLTAERFVSDPFDPQPGARMYRTGDLVRWLAEGVLEFIGRIDHQVKISGVRVELAEVEAVLAMHPSVRQCLVHARPQAHSGARLEAYLVGHPGAEVSVDELRVHARRLLPALMVPSRFIVLPAFPRTATGKVDRAALVASSEVEAEVAPPSSHEGGELAVALLESWHELLGVDAIGLDDDFFALGGHSLLAVTMLAQLARHFRTALPLAEFLRRPTIRGILEATARRRARPATPRLLQPGPGPALVCYVPPISGSSQCYELLAEHLRGVAPQFGLEGPVAPRSTDPLRLSEPYVDAAARLAEVGELNLVGWSQGGLTALGLAMRLHERGIRVESLVLLDTWAPWAMRALVPAILREFRPAGPRSDMPAFVSQSDAVETRRIVEQFLRARPEALPLRGLWLFQAKTPSGPATTLTDPSLGWRGVLRGLRVRSVPGDHDSMVRPPHVEALARALTQALPCMRVHPPREHELIDRPELGEHQESCH